MKRLMFSLVFLFFIVGVFGVVDVVDYSVQNSYSFGETLSGQLNLSLEDESYDQDIESSSGDSMDLGSFLESNGADYDCSPDDCSVGYSYSSGEDGKTFDLISSGKYVGVYFEGGDIEVSNFNFSIDSNFGESSVVPLSIDFFDGEEWSFNFFSDSYLNENWGCYDEHEGSPDALIGDSYYCELISIGDSGSLRVGAVVDGSDNNNLSMIIYPNRGASHWGCEFDPASEGFCEIFPDAGDIFDAGDYEVCVGADSLTSYKIYSEDVGINCGFVHGNDVDESEKDYAIFVQNAKYESANYFGWDNFDYDDIVDQMNRYIEERYDGSCEDGCVLPMEFSGISQRVRLSNLDLVYTDNGEWQSSSLFYDLMKSPALVNFDGVLDLDLLGFEVVESGDFVLFLGGEELFEESFVLNAGPIVSSVSPLDPPYGVPVDFYASVAYNGSSDLEYTWDFGDGTSVVESSGGVVNHKYNSSGSYILSLTVDAGGDLVSEKNFNINTVSPRDAVVSELAYKLLFLEEVEAYVSGLPSWYASKVSDILNLDSVAVDLDRIVGRYNVSTTDIELIDIAEDLFALRVPTFIGANRVSYPYFVNDLGDVDVEPVEILSGSGSTGDGSYPNAVLTWQNQNIDVDYSLAEFVVDYDNGEREDLVVVYSMDVVSFADEESYFVIQRPFDELFFNGDVDVRKAGEATVIVLDAGESRSIEFYYVGTGETSFFVSPKLSSLVLSADINEDCNYNGVCEGGNGETWVNCRNDCKPVFRAWVFFVLGFFILLGVYTGLQIWYNKRYEEYLFSRPGELYNLLMFISNARARGMQDLRIETDLRGKGWSSERVNYAMKKSRGKRVGMFEVIPVSKIEAWLRDRKAKKKLVATPSQGNVGGNINKPVFPQRY